MSPSAIKQQKLCHSARLEDGEAAAAASDEDSEVTVIRRQAPWQARANASNAHHASSPLRRRMRMKRNV